MNTKNNRRSQETQDRMENALMGLLEHMDILDITVSKLCQSAKVNRSTFYSHFDSIADVMEALERKMGFSLIERLQKVNPATPFSPEHVKMVLEHIRDHQNFYRVYLTQSTAQHRLDWSFDQLLQWYVRPMMHQLSVDDQATEYYFTFFRAGFVAIIQRWLQNYCRETPEVILSYLQNMLAHPHFQP